MCVQRVPMTANQAWEGGPLSLTADRGRHLLLCLYCMVVRHILFFPLFFPQGEEKACVHVYLAPLYTGERKVSSYVLVAWCIQLQCIA